MNRYGLILRTIVYHTRSNLAVLMGAAVGAAVLVGALLVGDSLRGSLRARAERQLNGVDSILVGTRFVRTELADDLPAKVVPMLLLQGTVRAGPADAERQIGKVTVLGVDARSGRTIPANPSTDPRYSDFLPVSLGVRVAEKLQVKVGDPIFLGIKKASSVPQSSFLGEREATRSTQVIRLVVSEILSPDDPGNDFTLNPGPALPFNLFLPLQPLQEEFKVAGRVNALLATGQSTQSLQSELRKHLQLADWDLKVHIPTGRKYISVESRRMLLEPYLAQTVERVAKEMGLQAAPTYVYLATSISDGTNSIPYSVVAALDPTLPEPLGPFLPPGVSDLKPGEIALLKWDQSPLKVQVGDTITLHYFKPEIEDHVGREENDAIDELSAKFTLVGFIEHTGAARDPNLTPEFQGITDKRSIGTWDTPFRLKTVRSEDEEFWNRFKTTPKAYIRLEEGQELWKNRFGNITSIRIAPPKGTDPKKTLEAFQERLLKELDPQQGGIFFEGIRERLIEAGKGSTDFGMLFLAFSFFLILAALMLVGLLFRLNIDRRAKEIGLLRSVGYSNSSIRNMLLVEGVMVALLGSVLGLLGAVLYAQGMLDLLVYLWPDQAVGSFLRLHVSPWSLLIGLVSSVGMCAITIYWTLRALNRVAPTQLLRGDTTTNADGAISTRGSRWSRRIAFACLVGAIGLAVAGPFMPPGEPQAGTFFGSGGLLLTAGLALLWGWLKSPSHAAIHGGRGERLRVLATRNATRNPTRSVLTAGLLASAVFLIVAVESFRREPDTDFQQKNGGSGGFSLVASTATPVAFDLNTPGGRNWLELAMLRKIQDSTPPEQRADRLAQATAKLKDVQFFPFRVHAGDDASCLNLYQATRPRLLGVSEALIDRGGFRFASTLATTPEEKANPWKLLHWKEGDATIPILLEENTAMWMLKKGLGDIVELPDEEGKMMQLRIVGMLKDSVFQSELLMPDTAFRARFPRTEGFAYFLVETAGNPAEIARELQLALGIYGFDAESTRDRVAAYLAVQNTYLTTFQLLGGLGLMLGVLGLAVVLLRSIWERRGELALLRALGYSQHDLNRLVMGENVILLVLGLGVGLFAAGISVFPHLVGGVAIPWLRLTLTLASVLILGMVVIWIAARGTSRAPLIPALRKE